MSTSRKINIQDLSEAERILLAEELWDSVAANQESIAVTEAQKKILDERLGSYESSPEAGSSWTVVKDKMK